MQASKPEALRKIMAYRNMGISIWPAMRERDREIDIFILYIYGEVDLKYSVP